MDDEQAAKQRNEQDVAETKQLRVDVDRAIQSVQAASTRKGGRAISIAITKLEEAKMWLGKRFEEIGRELPEEYRDKYEPEQNQGADPQPASE